MSMERKALRLSLVPDYDRDAHLAASSFSDLTTSPLGVLTPTHIGEEVFDSVGKRFYKATGLTDSDWVEQGGGGGGGAVASVFGRTGTVTAQANDYAVADINGLPAALSGKANATHSHAIADTTGLQTALDGKAATVHNQASITINDSSIAGRALLTAADVGAQKAALSIDDLVTLSGVSDGAQNLGTFTGSTITNNQTIKAALQELETAVEAAGGGSIADDSVTNAKLANMAQATIKGRAAGAGSGDPTDLTAAQARAAMGLAEASPDANAFIIGNAGGTAFEVQTLAQTQQRLKIDKFPIPFPLDASGDGTYTILLDATFAFTIASLTHIRTARTAGVVAVKINGTDVTSLTAIAPAATKGTTNATGANAVAIGDTVTLVISGTSDMTGQFYQLNCTR